MPDFSPEDLQIQKAMLNVTPPFGSSRQLLNQLVALQQEDASPGSECITAASRQETTPYDHSSKKLWLDEAIEQPATVGRSSATLAKAPIAVNPTIQPSRRNSRTRLGLLASAIVLLVATTLWWWQPNTFSNQLEWQVAQQIEQIEANSVAWQTPVSLPTHLRPILNQTVTLEPLGFAKIQSKIAGENIRIYSFRNREGKQILVFEFPADPRREEYGSQLAPMNTSTGGWSFAVAGTPRSLVVFAVPGNQQYLLRHLRNSAVT
jgi:hypothetical protein